MPVSDPQLGPKGAKQANNAARPMEKEDSDEYDDLGELDSTAREHGSSSREDIALQRLTTRTDAMKQGTSRSLDKHRASGEAEDREYVIEDVLDHGLA